MNFNWGHGIALVYTVFASVLVVFVVKSSGLTPAAVVPTEKRAELVRAGEAIKAGDNYTTGMQMKPCTKQIDFALKR